MKWDLARQLTDYAYAGVVATSVHYLVMGIALSAIWISAVFASTIGATLGAIVAYWMNARWTFNYRGEIGRSLGRFFFVAGIGIALNATLLATIYNVLSMPLIAAQPMATLFVFITTFVINRQWSFR